MNIVKTILRKINPPKKVVFRTAKYLYRVNSLDDIDWAFIQPSELGKECRVKFVNNKSSLVDEMTFEHEGQAYIELERNKFIDDNKDEFDIYDEMIYAYSEQIHSELNSKYPNINIPTPPRPPFNNKLGKNPYSSGKKFISPERIRINNNDYWVKATCFEFVTLESVLIEKQKDGKFKVFFIRDNSYVFDIMNFESIEDVEKSLTKNGFEKYDSLKKQDNIKRHGHNKRLHELILRIGGLSLPEMPLKIDKMFLANGYSSGKF